MGHPFGDLVSQHLHRKHGLSQAKLAAGILQEPTVITAMCKGRRLTGPQARERVIAIIGWLHQQGALTTLDEANAMLNAAGMSGLTEREVAQPNLRGLAEGRAESHKPHSDLGGLKRRHNLPAQLTSFIGRERDIREIASLLGTTRLLTLMGAGGIGKTRLAIEVAARAHNAFEDGVWLIEFAAISDPTLAPQVMIQTLGLIDQPGRAPLELVCDHFEHRHALLVVDNCEHLIIAVAELVDALLRRCPNLHVLATSRETLRMAGETIYRVPSLTSPIEANTSLEQARSFESVRLFEARAQAQQPKFALTAANVISVARVCAHLDGIPLALELAAALTQSLSVVEIASRLDAHLALVSNGFRASPPRHQTMRAALDWSYDLLSTDEQRALARLSVFAGGCTLHAITAVAGANLPMLDQLVHKSLVLAEPQGDHMRYRLLEPIRQYAAAKLDAMGEVDAVRRRHAQVYLALAEAAEPMLYGIEQIAWLEQLGQEHDNLRAALHWIIEASEATIASQLGIALWHFWYMRSHHQEGLQWLERILGLPVSKIERAKLLYGLGMLARRTGSEEMVYARLTEALDLFREVGDGYGMASVLRVLGFSDFRRGKFEPAQQKLSEALALFRDLGQAEGTAATLANLAYVHSAKLEWASARTYQEESMAIRRRTGNQHGMATSLDSLGLIAIRQDDMLSARAFLQESAKLYEALSNRESSAVPLDLLGMIDYLEAKFNAAYAQFEKAYAFAKPRANKEHMAAIEINLALATLRLDRDDEALAFLHRALTYLQTTDNPEHLEHVARALAVFSLAAFKKGWLAFGLRAAGYCERIKAKAARNVLGPNLFHDLDLAVASARASLDPDEAAAVWVEGQAMPLDAAIAFVLDQCAEYAPAQ